MSMTFLCKIGISCLRDSNAIAYYRYEDHPSETTEEDKKETTQTDSKKEK